jgi:putative transposase
MKRVSLKYFYYYQARRDYVGHLLQGRFKSKVIGDERYFLQCGKYIELNPIRAQLVFTPEDYPYSSYRHYASGQKDNVVDDDFFYLALADNSVRRRELYANMLVEGDKCLEQLRLVCSNPLSDNGSGEGETSPNKKGEIGGQYSVGRSDCY